MLWLCPHPHLHDRSQQHLRDDIPGNLDKLAYMRLFGAYGQSYTESCIASQTLRLVTPGRPLDQDDPLS